MPLYEFSCSFHASFEISKPMSQSGAATSCPTCGEVALKVITMPNIKIVNTPRLQFGSGSAGRVISPAETGGMGIYIPSMGAMEQQEVDYIATAAMEKEKSRIKKKRGPRSEMQARIQAYANLAKRARPGQRAKVIRDAVKDTGDRILTRG